MTGSDVYILTKIKRIFLSHSEYIYQKIRVILTRSENTSNLLQ